MPKHDYLPYTDQGLETWDANFSTKVAAQYAALGVSLAASTQLTSLHADFSTRLATASNPDTKNKVATFSKNVARSALKSKIREIVRIIAANPAVSDNTRLELGMHIRDREPSVIGPPITRPTVRAEALGASQVGLILADEMAPDKTRKADGTIGALVWVKVDGPAPANLSECTFAGVVTRARHVLTQGPASINKTLWIVAQWINEKGQPGPESLPVSVSVAA